MSLFRPLEERLNLALPLVLLMLSAAELLGALPPIGPSERAIGRFIANIVFLNAIHIAFTGVLAAGIPEGREWMRRRSGGKPWRLWAGASGLTVAFFAVFFFGSEFSPAPPLLRPWLQGAVAMMNLGFRSFHNLMQIQGLSLSYNERLARVALGAAGDLEAIRRSEASERLLFRLAFLSHLAQYAFVTGLWGAPDAARAACNAAAMAIPVVLIVKTWRCESFRGSHKTLFLVRLLLFPLTFLSHVAMVGTLMCHGMEYLFVFRRMCENSAMPPPERARVRALSWAGGAFIGVLALPTYVLPFELKASSPAIQAVMALGVALAFLHYYADRVLFMMRDRDARGFTGELLWRDSPRPGGARP